MQRECMYKMPEVRKVVGLIVAPFPSFKFTSINIWLQYSE